MRFRFFIICAIIAFIGIQFCHAATAGGPQDIKKLMNRAQKLTAKMPAITPPVSPKAVEAARQAAKAAQSKEFADKVNAEIATLKKSLLAGQPKLNQNYSRAGTHQENLLFSNERLYLFVSSSMPIATLKNYAADIDKLKDKNIVMVMRGFVNGMHKIRPTMKFVRKILAKDPQCDVKRQKCQAYKADVNIDPILFARYKINAVPAIVYSTGINAKDSGTGRRCRNWNGDAWKVSGDVPLDYALEKIFKQTKNSQINSIIKQLRKGFY